jgi:cation diffusion facilitator family transporter
VLGFSGLAYGYARIHAQKEQFTFGTGKVYPLAGYTNAVVLLLVALIMAVESVKRLVHLEPVAFAEALPVAIAGLATNLASVGLLDTRDDHDHDHNLRAAYLHVLADALTSILAIFALLGGRYLGWGVLDPIAGLVGSAAITYWGVGILRASARQLLDAVASSSTASAIRARLEALGDARVTDLHLWHIGPGTLNCIVSLVASTPESLDVYRAAVLRVAPVAHLTIEVSCSPHRDHAE